MNSLRYRIRDLRNNTKISGEKFGEIFGVEKSTISNWENGRSLPSISQLIKMAEMFNVTTDYLLGRTDLPNYEYKIATSGLKSKLTEEEIREIILIVNEVLASKKTDK